WPRHETFDVILALDVVHATPNIPATLGHLRRLLRPGGALHLIETLPPARLTTMIWGLAADWWRFDDGLRVDSPLLSLEAWEQVLHAAGFANVGWQAADWNRS